MSIIFLQVIDWKVDGDPATATCTRILAWKSQLGNVSPMPIVANLSTQTTEMKVKTMVNLTLIIFYLTFEFVQVPALAIKKAKQKQNQDLPGC